MYRGGGLRVCKRSQNGADAAHRNGPDPFLPSFPIFSLAHGGGFLILNTMGA